jgi:electron transfer flavoprotein alpha subunit
MGMKIISLMKQVPLVTEMRMGSDGLMDRTKAKSMINADCSFGLEQALEMRKNFPDAELIVLSMGPPSFDQSLRKAVAMGFDRAVLLSDRRLGGSDTFATGLALATLIKNVILKKGTVPNSNLLGRLRSIPREQGLWGLSPSADEDLYIIFSGRQTSDGDTAHVPSQVAENLGVPQATFVKEVEYKDNALIIQRVIEGGTQTLQVPIPCVISISPFATPPRRVSLTGSIKSKDIQIETYNLDQIGLSTDHVGLEGSPTVVSRVVNIKHDRAPVQMVEGKDAQAKAFNLAKIIKDRIHAPGMTAADVPSQTPLPTHQGNIQDTKSDAFPRVDFRKGASGILTWAEIQNGAVTRSSLEILNPARKLANQLKTTVTCVLIGENTSPMAEEIIAHGADEVIVVDNPRLKEYSILPFASVIAQVVKARNPEIALFGATSSGRELAPRLASRLKAGVTADCTELKIGEFTNKRMKSVFYPCLEAIRPTYGESKLATIMGFWCPQMATARPGTFEILKADPSRKGKITRFEPVLKEQDFVVKILKTERQENMEQGLFTADIIVSGGLPCGELDNFKCIKELVECLQQKGIRAEWGASRQAVDHGFVPYGRQIGQTGKTVRPKIYIAVGISGTIQHVSGIKESGMIIAINKDPQANIFNYADYGIAGDYQEILSDLIKNFS